MSRETLDAYLAGLRRVRASWIFDDGDTPNAAFGPTGELADLDQAKAWAEANTPEGEPVTVKGDGAHWMVELLPGSYVDSSFHDVEYDVEYGVVADAEFTEDGDPQYGVLEADRTVRWLEV